MAMVIKLVNYQTYPTYTTYAQLSTSDKISIIYYYIYYNINDY